VLEPIDLYWLNRRLDIATEEVRRLDPEMAMWELKQAFPGLQTVSTAPNGNQIFNFADRSIEVGPMASNDEIAVALQNPFIKTENTRLEIMPTIAEQVAAIKAKTAKVRERAVAIVAESEATVGLANEELNKAEKVNEELRAELAGLNGGEPL
jgi:hypothetical protein